MPVIGRKGTIKRGKYQRKINFSLNFRAKVPSLKVRLSEENTKGKLVFVNLFIERRDRYLFHFVEVIDETVYFGFKVDHENRILC